MTTESVQSNTEQKPIGFWTATSLVTGNMVGSGIYLLPASLAIYGGISLFGWLVTSLGAIALAVIFAKLSHMFPRAGGPYTFTHKAFGDFIGFEMAWTYWVSVWIGNAAIVVALMSYMSHFFPILQDEPLLNYGVSLALLWLFTGINALGAAQAGLVQLVTAVLKLIPLFLIGFVGIFYMNFDHFTPFNMSGSSDSAAIMAVASLTLWSFIGLESATIPAEHVKNPQRTIPMATIFGTLIAASVYVISTVAVMGIIPPDVLKDSAAPFVDAAVAIWGPALGIVVAVSAVISSLGALNGWVMLQAEVPKAAAEDGLFPHIFKKTTKGGAPIWGLILSSMLITALLAFNLDKGFADQFTFIILLATLNMLIPYIMTAVASLFLFIKNKAEFSTATLIVYCVTSLLGTAYALWAILGSGMDNILYGLGIMLLGIPIYFWLKKSQA